MLKSSTHRNTALEQAPASPVSEHNTCNFIRNECRKLIELGAIISTTINLDCESQQQSEKIRH